MLRILFSVLIAVLSSSALGARMQEGCSGCQPVHDGLNFLDGTYVVCIDSTGAGEFPQAHATAIAEGIDAYWEDYFDDADINVQFTYVLSGVGDNCPSHDILITPVDPQGMVNYGATAEAYVSWPNHDGRGAHIDVNGDVVGNSSVDWCAIMAHEMGHILGFDQMERPECNGETIMHPGTVTSLPSATLCADKVAASQAYVNENFIEDGEMWDPSQDEEDCYDVYAIYVYGWKDATGWHYLGWSYGPFLRTDCGPPPI
jgi:hypothetical protein